MIEIYLIKNIINNYNDYFDKQLFIYIHIHLNLMLFLQTIKLYIIYIMLSSINMKKY